ncbi:DUF2066 domain-containing protein [soil metagenome]
MHKALISCLLTLTTLLYLSQASAVVVENLYQVTVPVTSHDSSQRQQAMVQALKQVLIKVSGNVAVEKLDKNAAIKTALTHVDNYVQQYTYAPNVNSGEVLRVKFDSKSINKLLQQSGQKVWGEERPLVLLWVVQATNSVPAQATIMSKDTDPALSNAMRVNAERRGLAMLMPLLDLQDIQHITVADLTQLNVPAIKEASKRYNAEAIIVGRLTQTNDGKWQSNWTLVQDSGQKNWTSTNGNVEAMAQTVDEASNALLEKYADIGDGKPINKDHVELTVIKVNGLSDYAKLEAYLRQLSSVKNVQVVKVEPTSLVFDITLAGDVQTLTQAISVDKKLQLTTDNSSIETANNRLTYQWQL